MTLLLFLHRNTTFNIYNAKVFFSHSNIKLNDLKFKKKLFSFFNQKIF